jgi:hypothetical protein
LAILGGMATGVLAGICTIGFCHFYHRWSRWRLGNSENSNLEAGLYVCDQRRKYPGKNLLACRGAGKSTFRLRLN